MGLQKLALQARKRMPGAVRRWARLLRHALAAPAGDSPALPAELFAECRVCASRLDLLTRLPKGAKAAEVGVEHGVFSRHILERAAPAQLHLIDLDFSPRALALAQDARVTLKPGDSATILASYPDEYFDWIYIDADHSFAGVTRDAAAASAKVKPGGFLVFNDFAHADRFLGAYGVQRAVAAFARDHGWPFAWFAYSPEGLYDVALRRPQPGSALRP